MTGWDALTKQLSSKDPIQRARWLERDHRVLLINDRGNSEFQILFKGYSGRMRARLLAGDYVTHFDIVGCGRKR
jgi:hypothetical protein